MINLCEQLFRRRDISLAFFTVTGNYAMERFRMENLRLNVAIVDSKGPDYE